MKPFLLFPPLAALVALTFLPGISAAQAPQAQLIMRSVQTLPRTPQQIYAASKPVAGSNALVPYFRAGFDEGGNSRTALFRGTTRLWTTGESTGLTSDNQQQIFGTFTNVTAANGFVAFQTSNGGNGSNSIWMSSGGQPVQVAAGQRPAPGTGGLLFSNVDLLGLNAGQVLYNGILAGASNEADDGLWLSGAGLVARNGNAAPDFPPGSVYTHLAFAMVNSIGHVAFYGSAGVNPNPVEALWAGPPGNLRVVARTGDPAPGFEPGWTLRLNHERFAFNSQGTVVFRAVADHPLFRFREVMYAGDANGLKIVALGNAPVPEGEAGTVWSLFDIPALNDAGELFFFGVMRRDIPGSLSDIRFGLWTGRPGQLRLVARSKDPAPDTAGAAFSDSQFGLRPITISDSGQVLFEATLNSSSQTSRALYATDKSGNVRLVVRTGTSVLDSPPVNNFGLLAEESSIILASSDGRASSMDAKGNFAAQVSWFDYTPDYPGNDALFGFSFAEAAPVIARNGQPASTIGVPGGRAAFQVTALGSRPATYQWKRNGSAIPGAVGPTLNLTGLMEADRGSYTVVVTNPEGQATSTAGLLSFPPSVIAGPKSWNGNAGDTAHLQAITAGPGPLTWQWQYKPSGSATYSNLPGAASQILALPSITADQAGRYRVIVANNDGTETSPEAVVTVAAAGEPVLTRVLLPGDPVPGITMVQNFERGANPVINNAGGIGFEGKISNDAAEGSLGTYVRTAGGSYQFSTWQAYSMNLSDSGVFAQLNSRPSTTIELGLSGNLQPLARRDTASPGGGGNFNLDGKYALADDGTTAFRYDTHFGSAVFIGKPGAVAPLARYEMAAPGLPAGVRFGIVMDPVINPTGTAAFFATLTGSGITEENDTSLWKGTASGVEQIVSGQELVPAAGAGVRVGEIRFPDSGDSPFGWNGAGQVAFGTTLAGPGITPANDHAVLAGLPGALTVVARDGVADGHAFDLSGRPWPLINRTGQVAFIATVTPAGTNDGLESLWLWTPETNGGSRQLIMWDPLESTCRHASLSIL